MSGMFSLTTHHLLPLESHRYMEVYGTTGTHLMDHNPPFSPGDLPVMMLHPLTLIHTGRMLELLILAQSNFSFFQVVLPKNPQSKALCLTFSGHLFPSLMTSPITLGKSVERAHWQQLVFTWFSA